MAKKNSLVVEVNEYGKVSMSIDTFYAVVEAATWDPEEIDKLKESLFDVYARATDQKDISG